MGRSWIGLWCGGFEDRLFIGVVGVANFGLGALASSQKNGL
jgi:hypothetical protein